MVLRLIGEEQNVAADAQSRFADMERPLGERRSCIRG